MQKFNCIIIEDEPLAAEILEDYIREVPFLQLSKVCSDALFAMEYMQKAKVDVVFLDIHLPKLKGLDFIRTLKSPVQVIITTAYQEYALKGYELNVVDYLLKPIEFSRFLIAVNKLRPLSSTQTISTSVPAGRAQMFFNVGKKKVKVYVDEILYIESLKEYIKVITKEKSILTKLQIGQVEELLKDGSFLRVHRSFIVAQNKIDAFSATDVEINAKQIPIGRSYKEMVLRALDAKS